MPVDRLILWCLWIGGGLLAVLALAAVLWLALFALGDPGGAAILRGFALLAFSLWAVDFVALVTLLAIARLNDRRTGGLGESAEAAARREE